MSELKLVASFIFLILIFSFLTLIFIIAWLKINHFDFKKKNKTISPRQKDNVVGCTCWRCLGFDKNPNGKES
jgi:hypothetical protein